MPTWPHAPEKMHAKFSPPRNSLSMLASNLAPCYSLFMSANYNGGAWIRAEKRLAIYIRDGFTCLCCGTDLREAPPLGIALDHLVPKSKGGGNESTNLVTICIRCNSRRGNKRWLAFYPAGAHARVQRSRRRVLNIELAKSIIENREA